jgi:hypothetical protein
MSNKEQKKKSVIELKLPKGVELRETQNEKCNEEGHFCAEWNGQHVCLKLTLKKTDDGYEFFTLEPCVKNPNKKIKIEEKTGKVD